MELRTIVFIHYKRYNFTTDGMIRIILLPEMEICPYSWIC